MRNPLPPPPAGTREDDCASVAMTRLSASLRSAVVVTRRRVRGSHPQGH